jgi:uncharacterized protein with HEPN domain
MEIRDSARIAHILEAARDIKNFIQGKDRSSLDTEKMLLYAVVRAIEIIGEASSQEGLKIRAVVFDRRGCTIFVKTGHLV